MLNKPKTKKVFLDQVSNLEIPLVESGEQKEITTPRYVVVRGGIRVSDKEYSNPEELKALEEKEFWQRVITRYPDGTKVQIVEFDKKLHRIW